MQASQILAAMLGLAGPLAIGAFVGRLEAGMIASMGGLALSGAGGGQGVRERMSDLGHALLSGTAAILAGTLLGALGPPAAIFFPFVAGLAALVGSISKPLVRGTTLFVLYSIIAMHLDTGGEAPITLTLLFLAGAMGYACLSLVLRPIFRTLHLCQSKDDPESPARQKYTAKQLLRRWVNTLGTLSGWQYPLRLTICLAAAESFEWLWPQHHGQWALITVVIVLQRDFQAMPRRIVQRSAGTLAGVMMAGLLSIGSLPVWAMIILAGLLAAGRIALREVNYAAYAVVMTLLLMVLLDFGRLPSTMLLIDRFVATIAGCGLALTFGYWPWSRALTPKK